MNKALDRAAEAKGIERGNRALAALKPYFRRHVVESIVKRIFPETELAQVWQILNAYEREPELSARIHLGALKLSGGSQDKLKDWIRAANQDAREVILPAEDPKKSDLGFVDYVRLSDEEKDALTNDDLKQYLDWIEKYYGA